MPRYTIAQAGGAVPLCGDTDALPWRDAQVGTIDNFPWHTRGDKQPTEFRLLYDAEAIYAQFICTDIHIFAEITELNGPVCLDSCVEMFASPDPDNRPDYFNLEMNCCGEMLVGFGADRHDRSAISAELAGQIEIATSLSGQTKDESPDDAAWWIALKLPFDVIGQLAGHDVASNSGDIWRGNFFRCGGKTDDQYACWNNIVTPQPDYHRPEQFGELYFA